MWGFVWDKALQLVLGLVGGAVAWFVTYRIAAPVVEFEKTRRDVREALYLYSHAAKDWRENKIDEAEDNLRRLAARIEASLVTSPKWVRWYFKRQGWDLAEARSALHGLSNVMGTSRDERTVLRHRIEIALRFPLSDDPGRIDRLKARIDRAS
jgi:hypothetical protein